MACVLALFGRVPKLGWRSARLSLTHLPCEILEGGDVAPITFLALTDMLVLTSAAFGAAGSPIVTSDQEQVLFCCTGASTVVS